MRQRELWGLVVAMAAAQAGCLSAEGDEPTSPSGGVAGEPASGGGDAGGERASGGSAGSARGGPSSGGESAGGGSSTTGGTAGSGGAKPVAGAAGSSAEPSTGGGTTTDPACEAADSNGLFPDCSACLSDDCDSIDANSGTRRACGCSTAADCPCGLRCDCYDLVPGLVSVCGICVR